MTSLTTASPSTPFLKPIEQPRGLLLRMGYAYARKQFGKVFTPLSVFCARMPSAFTRFYGKISSLDKQLQLRQDTVTLIREQVAIVNGCAYCIDANRMAALKRSNPSVLEALDELHGYATSPMFTAAQRAALDYASELTRDRSVSPDTFAALSEHFSDREICDIVWVVASEHLYNINNIGLNIGSDGLCAVAASR